MRQPGRNQVRLGVPPEVDGLRIDPCLPSGWTRARMTRNWRGATYEIEITKPEGLCKGRASVTLDGRTLGDNLVPSHADGKVHEVKVTVQP